MLTLYFAPGASSMATHIALNEVGVPFEARPISFARKQQREPDFLTLNPEGKVPTLVIDGHVLTEVAGTLFYLARRYPAAGLLPLGDIVAEAEVIAWMSFIASTIHPSRRLGEERQLEVWAFAEKRLAGREWAVGSYSIADIHLFRLFWRWMDSGGPPRGRFPGMDAHYKRMMERSAVTSVIAAEAAIGYELPA